MNVWIFNHYALPPELGTLTRHYYLAQNLQKAGWAVEIFTAGTIHNSGKTVAEPGKKVTRRMYGGVSYRFLRLCRYRGNGLRRIFNMAQFSLSLFGAVKGLPKPDLIYASSPHLLTALSGALCARKVGCAFLLEVRDLWPESIVAYHGMSPRNPAIWLLYRLERWLYRRADAIVFLKEGDRAYLADKGWTEIPPESCYYVNNGVDLAAWDRERRELRLPDRDLDGPGFKVLYIGSLREANSLGLLVEAAEELTQMTGTPPLFLIYGDGPERPALEERCQKRGLSNVRFKGAVEKRLIPGIVDRCDLGVLCYRRASVQRYGGSQNKLFDYMAGGIPVVSNISMGYDLLERFCCGESAAGDTPREFARAMLHLMELPETQRRKLGENGRRGVAEFDFSVLSGRLLDAMEAAISRKRRGAP